MHRTRNVTDDVVFEILLNKKVEEIENLCYTNKKNTSLCESLSFWQAKLVHDHLPPLLIDDVRTIENYSMYLGIERRVDVFVELYNQMASCYDKAKAIIFINKVEQFNKLTTGTIHITNPHYQDMKLYAYLPKSIEWIESFKIKFKNQYYLYMDEKIKIIESDAIKIITYLLFDEQTAMIFDMYDEDDPDTLRITDSKLNSFLNLTLPDIDLGKAGIRKKSIYQTYLYLQSY